MGEVMDAIMMIIVWAAGRFCEGFAIAAGALTACKLFRLRFR
jgi:hypothetical protein